MDSEQIYIISQILTIIMYVLLGLTYQIKARKKVLVLSIFSNAFQGYVPFITFKSQTEIDEKEMSDFIL